MPTSPRSTASSRRVTFRRSSCGDALEPVAQTQSHAVAPGGLPLVLGRQVTIVEPGPGNHPLEPDRAREARCDGPLVRCGAQCADTRAILVAALPKVEGGSQFRSYRSARPYPYHLEVHQQ